SLSSLTALASHVIYTLSLHDALPIWVDAARVGDDLDLLLQGQREAVLELAEEGLGVTELGALHPVAAEDEHGQLGEVVAGEDVRSEEHTSELQSRENLVCRLLLEKKK